MRNVVFQKNIIEFHKVMVATHAALGNKEKTSEALRGLIDVMFPGEKKHRLKREEEMAASLVEESNKVYDVTKVSETGDD